MAKYSKLEVLAAIKETGMVPVFYNADLEISKNVVKACYEGGVRAFAVNSSNMPTRSFLA